MNSRRTLDLDRVLDAFLAEGPGQAPDRVLFGALDEVATMPQRRPLLGAWRRRMTPTLRLALAAALLIAALGAGAIYIGNQAPPPLPSPTPTAGPVGSPSAATTEEPAVTPGPTPVPTPAVSVATLVNSAMSRVDSAITAARSPVGFTVDDQSQLLRLADSVRELVDLGDVAGAVTAWQALSTTVDELGAKLQDEPRIRLQGAVAVAGRMLEATELVSGPLEARTYFATGFTPVVVVTFAEGWSRVIQDREVVAFEKGNVTLAFDHTAAAVGADDAAKAVGLQAAADLEGGAVAVTLGRFAGFSGVSSGAATLWFTDSSQAYDSAPGSAIHVWVVDVGGRPLTIHLDGPPAEIEAQLAEVEAMLATLESS